MVSLTSFQPWLFTGAQHAHLHTQMVSDNSNILVVKGSHPLSESFRENAEAMETLISRLNATIARVCEGGGHKAIQRNASRGKMLPRERIRELLDPGSAFLELSQLAGHKLYGERPA